MRGVLSLLNFERIRRRSPVPTRGRGVCRSAIRGRWCRPRYASTEAAHSDCPLSKRVHRHGLSIRVVGAESLRRLPPEVAVVKTTSTGTDALRLRRRSIPLELSSCWRVADLSSGHLL
jgi:hypothetical protein